MDYTVITGASSGIGKALAEKFAKEGHNLIIAARRTNLLNILKAKIEKEYQVKVIVFSVDLSNSDEVKDFYKNVKEYPIKIFINNAGFGDVNLPWDSDIKKIEKMIDLNIKTLTTLSIMFIKDNLDKDVQLINVSSIAGYSVFSGAISYSASKIFVASWTESVAKQLRKLNKKIKLKILAPGATESEFNDRALTKTKYNQQQIEAYKNRGNKKTAEKLAEEAYKLYKSDNILGIIKNDKLKMNDGYYDIRWV